MKKYLVISRWDESPSLHYYVEAALIGALNDGNFEGYKFLTHSDWKGDFIIFPSRSVLIFGAGNIIIPQVILKEVGV